VSGDSTQSTTKEEFVKKMTEHFPHFKVSRFPARCEKLDFTKDILAAEQKLMTQYGFVK
jgi:hypothetical protein